MNLNPSLSRMFGCVSAYFIAVVLLACLLSPPLYWFGEALAAQGIFPFLEGMPFHRYLSRCFQISALVLLWPAFRMVGLRRMEQLGIENNPLWKRDLTVGLALALLPLIFLAIGYVSLDLYRIKKDLAPLGILRIIGTAAIVSAFEEFIFRGVLLGLCLRALRPVPAAFISSLIFAGAHFMRLARSSDEAAVNWLSGFAQLTKVFSGAPPWPLWMWGFLSLLMAGLLLAFATVRTRSLFLAIGLHAGWIFGQQGLQWLAKWRVRPSEKFMPWIGPNVVSGAVPTGIIPLVVLFITAALVILYLLRVRHAGKFP